MRRAGDSRHGRRMRGLIVVLWRAGLRIHQALTLTETDLNKRRRSLLIRHGKGDRRRELGMDPRAWSVLNDWPADRKSMPAGPPFCVIDAPTRGPGRNLHGGDHRRGPPPPGTDDARQRWARALTRARSAGALRRSRDGDAT
jgi:integrase